ncbi:MAG: hypothetical protein ABI699_04025 [Caldimonas sp.]
MTASTLWRSVLGTLCAAAVSILAACDGQLSLAGTFSFCLECHQAALRFYPLIAIVANPDRATIVPGGPPAISQITVVYPYDHDAGPAPDGGPNKVFVFLVFGHVPLDPLLKPGVTINSTRLTGGVRGTVNLCASDQVPAELLASSWTGKWACERYQITVSADETATEVGTIVLSAQFGPHNVIERLGEFHVTLQLPPGPPVPGFQVAVGGPNAPRLYAVSGQIPITITRSGGFDGPVTLAFDGLASGILGTISPNPAGPNDSPVLRLDLPARYGAGGSPALQVTGTVDGLTPRSVNFAPYIDGLFLLSLTPATAALDARAPVDIEVNLDFLRGPFALNGPGQIDLSIAGLPDGFNAEFLPNASPTATGPTSQLTRTLRITSTDGRPGSGTFQVRATAAGLADVMTVHPYVEARLTLTVTPGFLWEFLGQSLSHTLSPNDTIGIARQANDFAAVAWLEGRPGVRKVYLRRFDGTTFASSPPGAANGLVAPAGDIGEASFALASGDVAQVGFTYNDGAGLAVGSAGAAWSTRDAGAVITGQARSPRIAVGAGDALTLSYLVQAIAPATESELFVRRLIPGGLFTPLAGPNPNGSLNRDASGRVLLGASALALRADASPVVAWLEQPSDPALPAGLWLRSWSGGAWGGAIAVPAGRTPVPAAVQLVVEPAGTVLVAWLEGSPERLMVARVDLASGHWTALTNTGSGDGSLNISSGEPARDVSLAVDARGRVVVAWTEGGLKPELWVKRQKPDTTWELLGSSVDGLGEALKNPRIVSDSNGRLYVGYTRFYLGANPSTPGTPDTDISVVRWVFD